MSYTKDFLNLKIGSNISDHNISSNFRDHYGLEEKCKIEYKYLIPFIIM